MRTALISLPMPGEAEQPSIAGQSLAERQLLFARELGCTAVIAHGGGASGDAIALRYAAEGAGLRFQVITNAHALPGAIGSGDSLLVIQPDLLPEAVQALDLLRAEGDRMLVISSGPGTAAGFERIDLDRAWAGVLTMPGSWLDLLTRLPEDAAPHAALLRICLQKRLPEARLGDDILDSASWTIIRGAEAAASHEKRWLSVHLGVVPAHAPSRWLGSKAVARAGAQLLARSWSGLAIGGTALALLAGSIAVTLFSGVPAAAFGLLALAVPLLEMYLALGHLAGAPFAKRGKWHFLRHSVDAAILAVGVLAIDGLWYRGAFPALVLGAALLLLDRRPTRAAEEPLRDRAIIALALGVMSVVTSPEIAFMAVAALCLAVLLFPERKPSE
ncbi:hypothetical protein [Erythrobacter sp. EC-HK427]|uniref:hypothetical protein n=1 Tax=Erythrobacter sp. EC-HK427 TaxID=2038396 RepID=UPI00125A3696|nr:hypothetical protein [Erythrobacter sp. EC-HK427]VVT16508.1 conserved membrane hypothetical protein [Erythrobacter sp. EC-HK427]